MKNSTTLIHLSDLHFKKLWAESNGVLLKNLLEDIDKLKDENSYIIFSGDLAKSGTKEEYDELQKMLFERLNSIGFKKDRIITVPGNHDVHRASFAHDVNMQMGLLATLTSEQIFNDDIDRYCELTFKNKFKNYIEIEKNISEFSCCASTVLGSGYKLEKNIGLYCLNSAICSFGGIEHPRTGDKISDQLQLMVDTRKINRWLIENTYPFNILVMHHPLPWMKDWAQNELSRIITDNFDLIYFGHNHVPEATLCGRYGSKSLYIQAPALFTRKGENLGYSITKIGADQKKISLYYRQWSVSATCFVNGTIFSGSDDGMLNFNMGELVEPIEVQPEKSSNSNTQEILKSEFDEAIINSSTKKSIWVERDLSSIPETAKIDEAPISITIDDILDELKDTIIRAPKQFGLTCLGRALSLRQFQSYSGRLLILMDAAEMQPHRRGLIEDINRRCAELKINIGDLDGLILDNWHCDKKFSKLLRELKQEFPKLNLVLLHGVDDCTEIAHSFENSGTENFQIYYLWSLSRFRIRELVGFYFSEDLDVDDDILTNKVVQDIDALNIHRTPINCFLILKWAEQALDDSPVNRTEMIGRVLYLQFHQFDKIPRYATKPDLKDCEYALGYLSETLVKSGKKDFSKTEFTSRINDYCRSKIIELDCEILFNFLLSENILVRKGISYEFRFSYWLCYFTAHRMHHDEEFREFIYSDGNFSAFPEILEFYAGIDRRRGDAVIHLTNELRTMNAQFLQRTGIPENFNPFRDAQWIPSDDQLAALQDEVSNQMLQSSLPSAVKDSIADKAYDRSRPYNQELAQFIHESSLMQLMQAIRGAARVLRNSDHVEPDLKRELMKEVVNGLIRVSQILVILSPALAQQQSAVFEGIQFSLDKSFAKEDEAQRWKSIMWAINFNVVNWYQDDIYSKKIAPLFIDYIRQNEGHLGELLLILILIYKRPPGWKNAVESFIIRKHKNSFYLSKAFSALRVEAKTGFSSERSRLEIVQLAAMAIAKHETGKNHPDQKLVKRTAENLEKQLVKEDEAKINEV